MTATQEIVGAPLDGAAVIVRLDPYEFLYAAQVGLARHIRNLARNSQHLYGYEPDLQAWANDIEGACAEFAVAKHLGKFWSGAAGRGADVGRDIGVRQTHHPKGHLVIHPKDPDAHRYVSAIGTNGVYRLAGWCYARFGKRQEWWQVRRDEGGAYYVPQGELNKEIDELR